MLDLVTVKFLLNYSTRPLQIFGLVGLLFALPGAGITGYLVLLKVLSGQAIGPRLPLLLVGTLLVVTGVQLITVGLLAELQARTYHESQDKPTYVIREIRDGPATPAA